jgi:predicted NAD/FAD-dependent oxidoreductase
MAIAIIGAGAAGLIAAYALNAVDTVTVFEKSRGVGGRAATRWHDIPNVGRAYLDHGAQYLRDESPVMADFLHDLLPTADLVNIEKPVWTIDAAGAIHEGGHDQNQAGKWTYRQGLATFGKLIVEAGDLTVRGNTRVGSIAQDGLGFRLRDDAGTDLGAYDHVLITIPSGQAADLIDSADLPAPEREALSATLRTAVYRRCISVILGYTRPVKDQPFYAVVDTSRQNPVSWLALEHEKPGHLPPGHAALIVQMAGDYSAEYWDRDSAAVIADVAARASHIFGQDLTAPDWTEYQKWRYSQPTATTPVSTLNETIPGLWFAGDFAVGGRVHLAAQIGFEVAGQIAGEIG